MAASIADILDPYEIKDLQKKIQLVNIKYKGYEILTNRAL
jgi:uncharacterized iron-regulated protein